MVRSLWSAASGMIAQQTNVDTIANNLANVNSTGYKTEVAEFKSLLYQDLQSKTTTANGENKPISAQVGLGVRNSSITTIFKQGPMLASESDTAFAIEGKGMFAVRGEDGVVKYTRNGDFRFSTGQGSTLVLSTSNGLPVLDSTGRAISLNTSQYAANKISVNANGQLCYPDAQNNPQPIGITINANLQKSVIRQGYLEGSGVQVVDEMVNMIVAQRAYEMNAKAITTTDSMMELANNLKR